METLKMGFCEADITPDFETETVGFDRPDNRARGVLHRLCAQAAVFDGTGGRCCLVAIDNLGLTVRLGLALREKIAAALRISAEQVMLCFSHTHSAPNAAASPAYFELLCKRTVGAALRASDDLHAVKAGWGVATADIGVNRRPGGESLDRRTGVLLMTDAQTDMPRLMILRVTAHANVLSADNFLLSSDYFGVTRELLSREYGCCVMMTQGASGNVRPRFQQSNAIGLEERYRETLAAVRTDRQRRRLFDESMASLDAMAREIRRAVSEAYGSIRPASDVSAELFSVRRAFSSPVPEEAEALVTASEAAACGIDGTDWLGECRRLRDSGVLTQRTETEVGFLRIADGWLCGVPQEIMCETALSVAARTSERVFFGGYTNACEGYLPTAAEHAKGGYETVWSYLVYWRYHGRVAALEPDTADRLADTVAETVAARDESRKIR